MPLYCGVSVWVGSAPESSIGLSSWGWVKSALREENCLSAVLTSSFICTIYSTEVLSSRLLADLASKFLRDSV